MSLFESDNALRHTSNLDFKNDQKKPTFIDYLLKKINYFTAMSSSSLLHSGLFCFVSFTFIFVLLLNTYFFHANEIFYNEIQPLFDDHSILIDDIEKDSPLYTHTQLTCNASIIDLYDGDLGLVHDTIDSNQYTFIYM